MSRTLSILLPALVLLVVLAGSQNATAEQPTKAPILVHMEHCLLYGEITTEGNITVCCYEKGCVYCNGNDDCVFRPGKASGGSLGSPGGLTNPRMVAPIAPAGLKTPTKMPPVRILERGDSNAATPKRARRAPRRKRTKPEPSGVAQGVMLETAPTKEPTRAVAPTSSVPTKRGHVWVDDHWERKRSKR